MPPPQMKLDGGDHRTTVLHECTVQYIQDSRAERSKERPASKCNVGKGDQSE
jgi:hypothetical protein